MNRLLQLTFLLLALSLPSWAQRIYGTNWDGPSANRSIPAGSSLLLGSPAAYVDSTGNLTVNSCLSGCHIPSNASLDLPTPVIGNSGQYQFKYAQGGNITRISCSTDQGTVSINLEVRAEGSPNSAGTVVLGSALVCNSNTAVTTTMANPTYTANAPVALTISATSGSPSVVRVHVVGVP